MADMTTLLAFSAAAGRDADQILSILIDARPDTSGISRSRIIESMNVAVATNPPRENRAQRRAQARSHR